MRAATIRLSAIQAAYGLLSGAYLPFFGVSLAARGLPPSTIGLLLALSTVLRIAIAPIAGLVSDARDDRRSVMLVFTLLSVVGFAALAMVTNRTAIFIAGTAAIVLWSSTSPILESVTLRSAERDGLSYGQVRVWLSIAFVAGNVVSGFAAAHYGLGIIAPWLAISAALQLAAIFALPSDARHAMGSFVLRFHSTRAEARELLGHPVFLVFLTVTSLIQGSHIVYYTYSGLFWRNQGMSASAIGLIWPLGVLAEIALFAFSAHVVRRIDAVTLIAIGGFACALRWTIMAFEPSLPLLLMAQLLHGLTFAVPHLGAMYFILHATPPRLSATAQSLYSVSLGLTSSLALLPASHFFTAWNARIFLLMSAMAVLAVVLSAVLGAGWNRGRLTETKPAHAA
ncbi:MAG TPA: MFS transporter [Micropepsaceae bacterium]|jgi:PPP family 3-phenylpropionic acid transporter|nr:MFS transporter [Micropepsaceae bacterium]